MSRFNYATTRNKPTNTRMPGCKLGPQENKIAFNTFVFVAKHSNILSQHNQEWLDKFITSVGKCFQTGRSITHSQLKKLQQFKSDIDIKQKQPLKTHNQPLKTYISAKLTQSPSLQINSSKRRLYNNIINKLKQK
jgi:hypothetical protein